MGTKTRQIAILAILIIVCAFSTYSIHRTIWLEHIFRNLSFGYFGSLDWEDKILVTLGDLLRLGISAFFCFLFFSGVSVFYKKYLSKYDKVLIYLFCIWIFVVGLYVLISVPFMRDLILSPLLGLETTIHY